MKSTYGFNVERFNANLLNAINANAEDDNWKRPWDMVAGGYRNAKTNRLYRGVNVFLLAMSKHNQCTYWGTRKMWTEMGYNIKEEELYKGTLIVFFSRIEVKGNTQDDEEKKQTRGMLRTFVVYAGTQVDGWVAPVEDTPTRTIEQCAEVDALFNDLGVVVEFGGNRACYTPSRDSISLPEKNQFHTADGYDGTRLHELAHWTGHTSRLNRDGVTGSIRFGSPQYAFEELIAESCSAIVSAMLGIRTQPDDNTVKYLRNWLKAMVENDKWSLYKALKAGAQAADWIVANGGLNGDTEDGGAE